ncbi:pyruvate, phosphate dikinase [Tistrella mobilis]|uniref:putative PEP-binding protein n=1 Tax=Tistrella mobilis TaxID=171437 RepID=UPI003557BDC3
MATLSKFDFKELLTGISTRARRPEDILSGIRAADLEGVIFPRFADEEYTPFASGEAIHDGDHSGYLVLHRSTAQQISEGAGDSSDAPDYIYSVAEGDIDDFAAIKGAAGFFTNHPGKTTFSPVQSVSEGKSTIIAANIDYHESDEPVDLHFQTKSGGSRIVRTRKRWISTVDIDGREARVYEGDMVAMSGSRGLVFAGARVVAPSRIDTLYNLLTDAYLAAETEFGPASAWERLSDTAFFAAHREEIQEIVASDEFRGFQSLIGFCHAQSPLRVYVNVHKTACVVRARLLASTLTFDGTGLSIDCNEAALGVGLLRDERMWIDPSDIDILRILFLGDDCTTKEHYDRIVRQYERRHGDRYYSIFSARPGAICVVRTLCMPFSKFLPDNFDIADFAARHGLDPAKTQSAFRRLSGEREVYHGCRGIRLFSIRPDLARLWLRTVLGALARANADGAAVKVRFLLATLTLPDEASRFIVTLEEVASSIFGSVKAAPIEGAATMLETGGAFICLESILRQRGHELGMVGGLIGSNDFTTACLNMNRSDAPRHLIPGYVEQGFFASSPFTHVQVSVVGRAMHEALQRSTRLALELDQQFIWGLAGELTTDWHSVQWLARFLAPAGLTYLSTSPETIIAALLASAATRYQRPEVSRAA